MPALFRSGGPILATIAAALLSALLLAGGVGSVGAAPPPSGSPYSWHSIAPKVAPGPRDRCGFAYDPAAGYVVLYGGYDYLIGSSFYSDTWAYAGGVWTNLNLTVHPTAFSGFQMVYFPPLHGVIQFGGEGPYGSSYYNDTWLFSNGSWTQLHPTHAPPTRSQYAMAYDAATKQIVLFGGSTGGRTFQDTWVFNGKNWKEIFPIISPVGRMAESMVYDAKTKSVLMFGGGNSSFGWAPGTWSYKGGVWQVVPHAVTPSRSWTPVTTMANGTPVFFGGQNGGNTTVYNSSYEFFGGSWHAIGFGTPPVPRALGGITYDATDNYVVYFAGVNANLPQFYNDTEALY